jgi:hypothetical protein
MIILVAQIFSVNLFIRCCATATGRGHGGHGSQEIYRGKQSGMKGTSGADADVPGKPGDAPVGRGPAE